MSAKMKDDVTFQVFLISIQEKYGILPVMNDNIDVKKILSTFSEEEALRMKRKFRKVLRKISANRKLSYDAKRALVHKYFCGLAISKMKQNTL